MEFHDESDLLATDNARLPKHKRIFFLSLLAQLDYSKSFQMWNFTPIFVFVLEGGQLNDEICT